MTATTNRARAAVAAVVNGDKPAAAAVADVDGQPQHAVIVEPLPTTDLAIPTNSAPPAVRGSMSEKISYAKALAEASLLPTAYRKQPGNVLLAVEMGEALSLHPFVAIQNVHVIEGKPSSSAALVAALVRRAGHRMRVTGTDQQATAQIVRSDDPEFTFESVWNVERAQTAGLLGKDVWKKYRAAMLKARAITEVARDACPEVLMGLNYTPEELGASVDYDGDPDQVQQMVAHVDGRDWFADVALCQAVDECRRLYAEAINAGAMTSELATAISDRATSLEPAPAGVDGTTGEVIEG